MKRQSWQHVLKTEKGNPLDLTASGLEFSIAVVLNTALKSVEDLGLVQAFDRDDEGEAERIHIAGVQVREAGAFVVCQCIKASAGLFRC